MTEKSTRAALAKMTDSYPSNTSASTDHKAILNSPAPTQQDAVVSTSGHRIILSGPPTEFDVSTIQICSEKALSGVRKPEKVADLFFFVLEVRQTLQSTPALRWSLSPLPEALETAPGNSIALICVAQIRELISPDLQDLIFTWPARPDELLDHLDSLIKPTTVEPKGEPVPVDFPSITKPETMTEFIKRVHHWTERYFPLATESAAFSVGLAQLIYLRVRSSIYPQAAEEFLSCYEKFETVKETSPNRNHVFASLEWLLKAWFDSDAASDPSLTA